MAEWFKAPAWKACILLKVSRVRIPFSPPKIISLKVDVEGSEIDVLNGLKKLLKNNKVFLQIEIFDKNYQKVNNFLKISNFKLDNKISSNSNYADYYYKNF